MKKIWLMLVLAFALVFALAACSSSDDTTTDPKDDDKPAQNDDSSSDNDATTDGPQKGGQLNAAMFSAPNGQFNPIFYSDAYEANVLDHTHEGLTQLSANLEWMPSLAKDWDFNDDSTELTYFLNEGVKWHDGEEFTADDVVFTYTAIADPRYTAAGGVRVDYVNQLVGYEEYLAGDTDTFEGVKAIDPYTVTFYFKEPSITALQYTSFPIIPKHVFEGVAVEDIPEHPGSIQAGQTIGTGPFRLMQIQEGEQYVLEAFADYWQGEPLLDRIVWKVVNQDVMLGQLRTEELHHVGQPGGVPAADVEDVKALPNVEIVQDQDFGYQYLGFKHHHSAGEQDDWTDKSGWNLNEKVADVKVRQAIAYALNRQGYVDGLLFGLGTVLNAPFPEASWAFDADAVTHYDNNPAKAAELLDEAGFVDANGDGWRQMPDGSEWVLNLDYPTGNQVRERIAPIVVENLAEVNVKVNMRSPREAGAHFELVERNDTDWDMYLAGWGLSTGDPDPSGIHRSTAPYNYLRWNDAHSDDLLAKALRTPEALDLDFRKQTYNEWAAYYSEQLPAIPLYSQLQNMAFNTKFHGWEIRPRNANANSHLWWLEQ